MPKRTSKKLDTVQNACRWRIAHRAAATPEPRRHCGDPAQSTIRILAKVSVMDKDARGIQSVDNSRGSDLPLSRRRTRGHAAIGV
jgi:hypothetical protein